MYEKTERIPQLTVKKYLSVGILLVLAIRLISAEYIRADFRCIGAIFLLGWAALRTQIRDRKYYAEVYGWKVETVRLDLIRDLRKAILDLTAMLMVLGAALVAMVIHREILLGLVALLWMGLVSFGMSLNIQMLRDANEGNITLHHGTFVDKIKEDDGDNVSRYVVFSDGEKTWRIPAKLWGFQSADKSMETDTAYLGEHPSGLYHNKEMGVFEKL